MQDQEEGPAVTVGKRARPPRKEKTALGVGTGNPTSKKSDAREKDKHPPTDEEAVGESVDPDEPRYCLCGDVSYGAMVSCDYKDVSPHRTGYLHDDSDCFFYSASMSGFISIV